MAIKMKVKNPSLILENIKYKIDLNIIETWIYDDDDDFTLNIEPWKNRAWFHVSADSNYLIFSIIGRNEVNLTKEEYSIYHSKFIEMLLLNFYGIYEYLELLPKGNYYDPLDID